MGKYLLDVSAVPGFGPAGGEGSRVISRHFMTASAVS
jgi:hypothetical protein